MPSPTHAAIYCRSSKDKAEVGLAAQRKELQGYAKANGLHIADEFSDMEVSGSLDETSRPGLRNLLAALTDPERRWQTLLALDTSRLARDPMLALYITREAEKHGVSVVYAKMPVDGSSAFGETMLSVVRAFDRLHARLSSEKGRGGMETNIAKGFRAGGSAPFGYKLQHTETGATRGGMAVRKSTLVLDTAAAAKVKTFLLARSDGVARSEAANRAKLKKTPASLIAIERNALTYSGFTVWNVRKKQRPTRDDPRKTMAWRPRSEWQISPEPTHKPLITREQAERILAMHSEFYNRPPRVREPGKFILSGLLFTPTGVQYHGDSHDSAYRAGMKGTRINAPYIEGEILFRIGTDFADEAFLRKTVAEARRMAAAIEADPLAIEGELKRQEKRLGNLLNALADGGDKAVMAKVKELENVVGRLKEQQAEWAERASLKAKLNAIDVEDIRPILMATGMRLRGDDPDLRALFGLNTDEQEMAPEELRRVLTSLVERVELDPKSRKFEIRYRLPITGVKMASPRGFEPLLPP